MATKALPTGGPSAGGDEFDDLFGYEDDVNDPFSENYVVPGSKEKEKAREAEQKAKNGSGLGIDEEVEVTRKPRAPRVKLDENRLLSANGIPKLRAKAKHHLKLKGKGHEYSDASRLLSFYQLWLDDLFPKARFLDALAMVEKMGHKKRMQMMRMEWINEGKGHSSVHEDSLFDEPAMPAQENREQTATRIAPIFETRERDERLKTPIVDRAGAEDEDLYDATPRARRQAETQVGAADSQDSIFGGGSTSLFGPKKTVVEDDPPEDELDALLAEEAQSVPAQKKAVAQEDEFEDDLDALMAEEEMLQATSGNAKPVATASKVVVPENNYEDDEEAMMEMEW